MKAAIKTQVVLTPQDDATLRWQSASGAGLGRVEDFAALPESRQAELVFVVPGDKVLLQQVGFAAHERRLLRQTIPFALEEQLLDDVAAQHFALGPIDGQQVPVAVVERQWFADWLQRCQDAGLDIKHAVPETLLLPWEPDCWSLRLQGQRWLVRVDRWRGFALEADSAQLALQILLDDAEQLPQRLLIWIDATPDDNALVAWQAALPEMLRGIAVLQTLPAAVLPLTTSLDFLQGVFARRLPWQRWWTLWRIPLIAAAVAVLVQFVVAGIQHHRLQKENLALRQQVEQIYRSVEPSGAINDAERQLRRKVQGLRGSQGSAVLPTLQRLGGAIKSIDAISIQTLGYSEKSGEVRLNIVAKSFKDVEALRAAIAKTGLDAQLVGSNADGERTRAQLRIIDKH
ncbi:MAG: type II secretion system protein GspL [Spongiibacteraceae bacterium]